MVTNLRYYIYIKTNGLGSPPAMPHGRRTTKGCPLRHCVQCLLAGAQAKYESPGHSCYSAHQTPVPLSMRYSILPRLPRADDLVAISLPNCYTGLLSHLV